MRRWNGWGDEKNDFELKPSGLMFLQERLGSATPLKDASKSDVLQAIPDSRLPKHHLISIEKEGRLLHARGQSLPDWLAMRSGQFAPFPDGVAYPESGEEVRELLQFAKENSLEVIPYGGGTSVVGHINPNEGDTPVLTIDMSRMDKLIALDRESQIATFGAGTPGPYLEEQLKAQGYTLGHFPQSWELSTIGGWVISRSSGQQSMRYGRIEQMFAGGTMESPKGSLEIPTFPASSAGPDLREIVMGSEGRMGILTEVKIRVTPQAEKEIFYVVFLPDWEQGVKAVREVVQQKVPLSMLRLSNAVETQTHLTLAGHENLVAILEKYLSFRNIGDGKCMATFGTTGSKVQCRSAMNQLNSIFKKYGARKTGSFLGKKWEESRFRSPYLRHGLWEAGYAVDTMETSADWKNIPDLVKALEESIRGAIKEYGERVHVFTHLSHLYGQGSSIYTSYVFRTAESYEETLARWKKIKAAACETIIKFRSTISHQHGVGMDHAPYLKAEKGELGIGAIDSLCRFFDPDKKMNPGKLLTK